MKVERAGDDTTAHSRSYQEHFLAVQLLNMWTCWARPACRKACKLMGRKEEQLAGHAASCPEFPKTSASNKPDYAPFIPMIGVLLAFAWCRVAVTWHSSRGRLILRHLKTP